MLQGTNEQEPWSRSSLPEQGMSGLAGGQRITSTKPKVTFPTTPRGSYSEATQVEGQCPAAVDLCYAVVANYDGVQFGFKDLATLLCVP